MALASNALTTVATAEDVLGISTGTETTRLERLINAASDIVEAYAGRVFYRSTAIEEKVGGEPGPILFLARPPINSITSITYSGATVSSGSYEVHDSAAGQVYAIGGSWIATTAFLGDIGSSIYPGYERRLYTVTYDGGWYTSAQYDADNTKTRALPYDIEEAALAIVTYLRRGMGRDPAISSESLLGSAISYRSPNVLITSSALSSAVPMAASILDRYKLGGIL